MKKLAICALCVVLAASCIGCKSDKEGTNDTSSISSSSSQATATPDDSKDVAVDGADETKEQGGMKVTLKNVSENTGSTNIKPEDGNVFILCEFEVENTTDEAVYVSSILSFTGTVDGVLVNSSTQAAANRADKEQIDGRIESGDTRTGVLSFEVPSTWKELVVDFASDPTKEDKVTFNITKQMTEEENNSSTSSEEPTV